MPKWLQILVSLSAISMMSGLLLAGLSQATAERIEVNILKNKKMPAVESIFTDAENKLLEDRKNLDLGPKNKHLLFPAKKGGKVYGVGIEALGKGGFGGPVGVMLGIDLATDELLGIGITTSAETPGVGENARNESFTKQFKGLSKDTVYKVKSDGGVIDAVSGATITSRAVGKAVTEGYKFYSENKDKIKEAIK